MGKGIKRRKDGRYEAKYSVETDTGTKRRSIYGKSREEVAVKLAKAIEDAKDQTPKVKPTELTIKEFLEGLHDQTVRHAVKRRTYESYRCIVGRHIVPAIGNVKLRELSTRNVQDFYGALLNRGLSAKTVTNVHTLLRRALKQAIDWELITRNACEGVSLPRRESPEVNPLNRQQAKALLEASKSDRLHALYVLAISTGMRQGELLGLYWSDIDLDNRMVRVRRALVTGYGQTYESTKTKRSRRSIALTTIATEALIAHKDRMSDEGHSVEGDSPVFVNKVGRHLHPKNFMDRSFKPNLRKARIPDTTFHAATRHTAASLMLTKGVHPKVVQEMLGHATITITLDTYSHLLDGMGGTGATAMDDALS
ncbi:tyrosine-type recombinase/integrase [Rubrobacter tropicus]|uniref:Tyrosine-type recombinase/integrase n=1 Tax=Rubrobacter tropicus TaxID=2653851 RepID=A0A6G8QB47_9ACTN|nr:site-specific integrase [Rubrobacter tropicus]QIN83689.1 tyrosine-type recombinase/integrase [Rubrobacter tropicus]